MRPLATILRDGPEISRERILVAMRTPKVKEHYDGWCWVQTADQVYMNGALNYSSCEWVEYVPA